MMIFMKTIQDTSITNWSG